VEPSIGGLVSIDATARSLGAVARDRCLRSPLLAFAGMPNASPARLRAFVRRTTRLQAVPDVPDLRLHLADDVMEVCRLAGVELGQPDPPLPYWAFAWAGGLAVARYLHDHPEEIAGRRVVDVASGSGLCAIVALRLGAASALALDIDPLAEAAVAVNGRANGIRVAFGRGDVLDAPAPPCDVILAGDVCYEETMARRTIDWLRAASARGTRVLLGDLGRKYLPAGLERLATYDVRTSLELENAAVKRSHVFTIPMGGSLGSGAVRAD
jgi:predicted nicotinamide N-methyase